MVTVTLVNACAPYLPLQHWHARAPWERVNLKCTVELAVTLFTLEARDPRRATGHTATPEPSSTWTRGRELWITWQCVVARHMTYLDLKPIHIST
jgi:hypothetical protein